MAVWQPVTVSQPDCMKTQRQAFGQLTTYICFHCDLVQNMFCSASDHREVIKKQHIATAACNREINRKLKSFVWIIMSTSAAQVGEIVWLQLNWTILQFATAIKSHIINAACLFVCFLNVGIDRQHKKF